jgi:mxaJ protein
MCLRCRKATGGKRRGRVAAGALALATVLTGAASPLLRVPASPPLRVCSDPNNLPFSNQRREGFENEIAGLLAKELHTTLEYAWAPMWRGFVRKTVGENRCDVIMGIPAGDDRLLTTRPYYTSTYVFLWRKDRNLKIRSFDDPALRRLRIGIHFIGDDYTNPPPAHALGRRHIVQNVVGYSIYGDYSQPNPTANLVRAVARREVDLAIVWGPFAGYFGPRSGVPMTIEPVKPAIDPPGLRFSFPIAIGVRRGDEALRERLDAALQHRQSDVRRILTRYGVPLVSTACVPGREAKCG